MATTFFRFNYFPNVAKDGPTRIVNYSAITKDSQANGTGPMKTFFAGSDRRTFF